MIEGLEWFEVKEPEIIQLDKEAFQLVIDSLEIKNPHCKYCKVKVTKDNFGFIARDVVACDSLFCQMKAMNDFEEENKAILDSNKKVGVLV